MKNNNLLSIRSNCNFSLSYTTGNLTPQVEVILITSNPKYAVNKAGDKVTKEQEVSEYRFITTLEGVNQLIGELQLVAKNIMEFEQMAAGFNKITEAYKEANKQNEEE